MNSKIPSQGTGRSRVDPSLDRVWKVRPVKGATVHSTARRVPRVQSDHYGCATRDPY